MDERNRLDRDRTVTTRITDEERRLIDEAVAAGRVTRVPTGPAPSARIMSGGGIAGQHEVAVG